MRDPSEIYRMGTRRLKDGRDAYAETFGHSVMDPAINTALGRLFREAEPRRGDDVVGVPARLLLAVLLRAGGRANQRPVPDIHLERHRNENPIEQARRDKAAGMRRRGSCE